MDSAMIAGLDARYLASVMKVRFFPLTIASADGCRITDTDGVTRRLRRRGTGGGGGGRGCRRIHLQKRGLPAATWRGKMPQS